MYDSRATAALSFTMRISVAAEEVSGVGGGQFFGQFYSNREQVTLVKYSYRRNDRARRDT